MVSRRRNFRGVLLDCHGPLASDRRRRVQERSGSVRLVKSGSEPTATDLDEMVLQATNSATPALNKLPEQTLSGASRDLYIGAYSLP